MSEPAWTLSRHGHPREFPSDVQDLFDTAERVDLEFGATWYANLVDSVFPEPGRAVFYVLRCRGRVEAVLPLERRQRNFGYELHSLSNFYTSRWQPLVAEDSSATEVLAAMITAIRASEPGLIALRLDALDSGTPTTLALLGALDKAGFARYTHFRFKNWTLDTAPDWPAYLASRKSKQRSDLKRMLAKLQEQGGSLSICRGGDALESALADYLSVYSASWKRAEPFEAFIPGLVRAAAERGWLRLGRVHLNGHAIAAQIWLVCAGRAAIFKVAYDEAFKAYSPGSLCTAHLMRSVMEEDKVGHVDYLIGDDAYKRLWMSQCRDRIGLIAFNRRNAQAWAGLLREHVAVRTQPLRQRLRARFSSGSTT